MKKLLILLLATFIVLASHAQKDPTEKADTVATVNTPLLSLNDILGVLGKHPMDCAEPIRTEMVNLLQRRAQEYYIKRKEALKKH